MKTLNAILIICAAILIYMFISRGDMNNINSSRIEKENRINNIEKESFDPIQNIDNQSSVILEDN